MSIYSALGTVTVPATYSHTLPPLPKQPSYRDAYEARSKEAAKTKAAYEEILVEINQRPLTIADAHVQWADRELRQNGRKLRRLLADDQGCCPALSITLQQEAVPLWWLKRPQYQPPLEPPFKTKAGILGVGRTVLEYFFKRPGMDIFFRRADLHILLNRFTSERRNVDRLLNAALLEENKERPFQPLWSMDDAAGRTHASGYAVNSWSKREETRCDVFIPALWGLYLSHLWSFDMPQAELRIAACASNDQALLAALNKGDFHANMVSVYGCRDRDESKMITYAMAYGGGIPFVVNQLGRDKAWVKELFAKVDAMFPDRARWRNALIADAAQNGYVVTMFGRRILVDRDKAETEALNRFTQGTVADFMMYIIPKTWDVLGPTFVMQQHDAIYCRDNSAAAAIRAIFENPPYELSRVLWPFEEHDNTSKSSDHDESSN